MVSHPAKAHRSWWLRPTADKAEAVPTVGSLAAFYRHIQLDLPRIASGIGVLLLIGVLAIRLYKLVDLTMPLGPSAPGYFLIFEATVAAVALASAGCLCIDTHRAVTRIGWALGSLVCLASIAMYFVSRTIGLPGLGEWVGQWTYPLGSFAVLIEGVFVLTGVALITGLAIAVPDKRNGHD